MEVNSITAELLAKATLVCRYILLHENEPIDFFYFYFCNFCVVGGLVYGNTFHQGMQYHAWTSFISDSMFCMRACHGPRASELCNNIYDEMGCEWVRFSFIHSLTHPFQIPHNSFSLPKH